MLACYSRKQAFRHLSKQHLLLLGDHDILIHYSFMPRAFEVVRVLCVVFQILGSDRNVMVVLAASCEEELTQWMQALCVAQMEMEVRGEEGRGGELGGRVGGEERGEGRGWWEERVGREGEEEGLCERSEREKGADCTVPHP